MNGNMALYNTPYMAELIAEQTIQGDVNVQEEVMEKILQIYTRIVHK